MTREEFMTAIANSHIRQSAFSLEDDGQDECYILTGNGSRWNVHYSERGLATQGHSFGSESEALQQLFEMLKEDPTTRTEN